MRIGDVLKVARSFLSGGSEFAGLEPAEASRIRREQARPLLRQLPLMMAAKIIIAGVVTATFWDAAHPGFLIGWSILVLTFAGSGLWNWLQFQRTRPEALDGERLLRWATSRSISLGLLWAVIPIILFPVADPPRQLLICSLAIGMIGGGAVALAAIPQAALLHTIIITTGTVIGLASGGSALYLLSAAMLAMYSIILSHDSIGHSSAMIRRLLDQIEIEKRGDVINLLLKDFEEHASDWLWETDADGRLTHVSVRLAEVVGVLPESLDQMSLLDILCGETSSAAAADSGRERLIEHFAARSHFRNLIVSIQIDGERRWWSLSGKPSFEASGDFTGYRGVGADVTESRIADERIAYLARYDLLTDLANRTLFTEDLTRAIARQSRSGEALAVLCFDLDHFKAVNDTFGHPCGDALLRAVATRLKACTREVDTVSRFGGDEFAVLQVASLQPGGARRLAERIIAELSRPFQIDGVEANIGVSVGIALSPDDGCDPGQLMKRADLALYRAKANGGNALCYFEPEMDAEALARHRIETELRIALKENQFEIFYQPLIDLESGRAAACEALLRWRHPVRGLVGPDEFIKVAEETGLIIPIGEWVIRKACLEAAAWPPEVRVAVNLSVNQFKSGNLLPTVMRALAAAAIEPGRLELEITESVVLDAEGLALRSLDALKRLGVRIVLDDFGTGFSSLSYLRSFPFDKIKIDRTFVSEMETRKDCAAIVRAVTRLAVDLEKRVTAEGVESLAQVEMLRAEGCHEVQGFLFSEPVPAGQLLRLLHVGEAADRRRSRAA